MPKLGDIEKGRNIGQKNIYSKFIWTACANCGKERWVHYSKGQPVSKLCLSCVAKVEYALGKRSLPILKGEAHPNWKGGRIKKANGYICILLRPDNPFYLMTDRIHYVMEHRLVMARHLGRCLQSWELVHHKNHIRDDNRIENLQLVSNNKHQQITIMETRIGQLEQRVTLLEAENAILTSQLLVRSGEYGENNG